MPGFFLAEVQLRLPPWPQGIPMSFSKPSFSKTFGMCPSQWAGIGLYQDLEYSDGVISWDPPKAVALNVCTASLGRAAETTKLPLPELGVGGGSVASDRIFGVLFAATEWRSLGESLPHAKNVL